MALDTWVTGAIGAAKDADYYAFTAPDGPRDWSAIEVKNQSTTLEPRLELFDGEKTSLGEAHKTTAGADLVYRFVATPGAPQTNNFIRWRYDYLQRPVAVLYGRPGRLKLRFIASIFLGGPHDQQ